MAPRKPLLALLLAAFCGAGSAHDAANLYVRLGGTQNVSAFVADTLRALERRDSRDLEEALVLRICALSQGNCRNSAPAIDHSIEDPAFLEALRVAMRARDVPLVARNELLELITGR